MRCNDRPRSNFARMASCSSANEVSANPKLEGHERNRINEVKNLLKDVQRFCPIGPHGILFAVYLDQPLSVFWGYS